MKPAEAKQESRRRGVNAIPDGRWVCSCKIQARDNTWWLNIPVKYAASRYVMLLHDPRIDNANLHILDIPAGFFQENADRFYSGCLSEREIFDIRLSANNQNMFYDIHTGGSNVSFARFVRNK